jgi:hypothetical protein
MLTISMEDEETQTKEKKPGHIEKRRPYWHVDMKWVSGILLLGVLALWLSTLAAYRITAPSTGITLMTNVLAYNFSRNGLDDNTGFDQLKAKILKSPTKSIKPIAGFPVVISLNDITTLSPRDLRLKLFGQIAKPLYYEGAAGYAKQIANDPVQRQKFVHDASILDAVTLQQHRALGKFAVIVGIVAALLLAAAVYFSSGFGRLVTPAIILLIASIPGAGLFSGLRAWAEKVPTVTSAQAQDVGALLNATKGAFTGAFTAAQKIYLVAVIAAVVLLFAAAAGKIVMHFLRHKKKAA